MLDTKDEALKMAIEALESCSMFTATHDYSDYFYESIGDALQTCKEALAQPAQEPVAWMSFPRPSQMIPMREFNNKKIFTDDVPLYTHPAPSCDKVSRLEVGDAEIRQMLNDIEYYQKRVEALEQPSWQGLSDDEISKIWSADYYDHIEFARVIEQALKEKNHD